MQKIVTYMITPEIKLHITELVINELLKFKQPPTGNESGGILLGKVYSGYVLIDQISKPCILDKCGNYFFKRNLKKAQRMVDEIWKESAGERIYLGEWHTHPELKPHPSIVDINLIKGMHKDSQMEINFLFEIIIGWRYWTIIYVQGDLCIIKKLRSRTRK